ncbi:hypothetical protein MASR2M74_19070 [Paracoccaceae bacterium]
MRDEALFLVEWVAHHLAIGFDRIIVYTNDCSDGTDKLLAAMAGAVPVEHYPNPGPYTAGTIQKQALHLAFQLPQVRNADWVLHIDADEYLNVETGTRRINDLIALFPDVDAIAIQWRHFGNAGQTTWAGGSVIETYRMCEGNVPLPGTEAEVGFKTLFRPRKFKMMGVHTPKKTYHNRVPAVVNTAGTPMPVDALMTKRNSGYPVDASQCTWANACLHHHHVKSDDLQWLKHSRGDANGRANTKRMIGSDHYRLVNRNEVENDSLLQLRARVAPIEAAIRALPLVAEVEASALAWFRSRYQDAGIAAAMAEKERIALDWLLIRLDEIRRASGTAKYEARAVQWFTRLLARLDAAQDSAEQPPSSDPHNTAQAVAGSV